MNNKIKCLHCGPVPTLHWVEYFTALMDWLAGPFNSFVESLYRRVLPKFILERNGQISVGLVKGLMVLRLAKVLDKPQAADSDRTKCLWQAAQARGIKLRRVKIFYLPTWVFLAEHHGRTWLFDGLPRPDGAKSKSLLWMDDKGVMQARFSKAGIPVAKGGVAFTRARALELFLQISGTAIVKPSLGSRSRHTVLHINDRASLLKAFAVAKQLSPWVAVQEELKGRVHRVTLISGKVVGVLRRDPPYVVGDGQSSVRELVRVANLHPMRQGPVFHHILMDTEAQTELKRQNLNWDSLPAAGREIVLRQNIGRGSGGVNSDVTDLVHPENLKLFEKIGQVLADSLVGVDLIIQDVSAPWQQQPGTGVIECNSLPFIDLHHYPFSGPSRDAAGLLWDSVLSAGA